MPENNEFPSILGVGNALVDIMIDLPDDGFLQASGLPRGSMTLVDSDLSARISEATRSWQKSITTGGSAANTIHTLSCLGASCGYIGKICRDEWGSLFEQEFHLRGIQTHLLYSPISTGRVMAMVSPDSERTMATFLGAAAELVPEEFTVEMMKPYHYLYVEGYLIQNHRLIETILKTGQEAGLEVVMDLSSYNIVEQNREFLEYLIRNFVDIVFANEEEALAFTGQLPERAVSMISDLCELAIVKTGKTGSLIQTGDTLIRVRAVPALARDTTGAGDSYAAGMLYGLSRGLTLRQCGAIASFISSRVVEILGAKIPEAEWPELRRKVAGIVA